jgi:hypothetical protein
VADPLVTKRQPLAQLLFCQGCCCGRTDRGHPEVPAGRLKAVWKAEKLNRSVQLTISGCLGPCDVANVALATGLGLAGGPVARAALAVLAAASDVLAAEAALARTDPS